MIEFEQFSEMVKAIMAQGFDEATASKFARLIGDTPVSDEKTGKWLVIENDQILAEIDPV